MRRDIDEALRGWPYDPEIDEVEAREVRARDGRTVVQVRIDLGILQMELDGRPDGACPRGFTTYLDYLRHRSRIRRRRRNAPVDSGPSAWTMSAEQCSEADRELVQFYHRRVAMLALQHYDRALRDADHSLSLMDFIADFGPTPDYVDRHERLRGGILFDRTQAAAAMALERSRPEEAIDAIREGIDRLERHCREQSPAEDLGRTEFLAGSEELESSDLAFVERLRRLEAEVRHHFEVPKTLKEQLDEAVEHEDYETAARLRDQIRSRAGD
ncbi:hypothetical protein TsocGM_09095 [Tautonia sociabilis]|uniref:UVR domain-containing protein n=2 Tax=Tautonia sociabilis TaxID=2080755 RepID=A0A432MLP6_9BACT|nr:hypothetical protein TsocGM_09095 [Tautonia sociabilis]